MLKLAKPKVNGLSAFNLCVSGEQNAATRLKHTQSLPALRAKEIEYENYAQKLKLHALDQHSKVGTHLSAADMGRVYSNRLVNGAGRHLYDELLTSATHCPFCSHRSVETLDHFLPKESFPAFAVLPANLIPSCWKCNHIKGTRVEDETGNQLIHPYYEDHDDASWLDAELVVGQPPVVVFSVKAPTSWSGDRARRVKNQFRRLGLASLYTAQATRELAAIRHMLLKLYDAGGDREVRDHLALQCESRERVHINSWGTATYRALRDSQWFCSGGFQSL